MQVNAPTQPVAKGGSAEDRQPTAAEASFRVVRASTTGVGTIRLRELVSVERRTDKLRRASRERIASKQAERVGIVVQQFRNQVESPWVVLRC